MNLQESIRRILREEVLNETKFFLRRIKLDDVKKRLPINAEMVYYDTETYDEFKYLLTLTAVEEIMWNYYKIHWEDLPEKEEIEFVTEVSEKLDDYIKYFYNMVKSEL